MEELQLLVNFRGTRYYKNGWIIGSVKINEIIDKDEDFNYKEGSLINIRGTIGFQPNVGTDYKLIGELVKDKQWGNQIEILSMNSIVKLTTDEDKKTFLKQIITEKQVEELYKTYEDPFKLLEDGDIASLIKVNGIKDTTAKKLIDRFQSTVDNAAAYVYFKKFEITNNMVKKLINTYGGAGELIQAFESNPYILIDDVDGIGFIKADEIALKSGIEKDSSVRIREAIIHFLKNEANNNGSTWVTPDRFRSEMVIMLGVGFNSMKKDIKDMIEEYILYLNEDKTKISLFKYYELEQKICNKIKEMINTDSNTSVEEKELNSKIHNIEEEQGFKFTDEQNEAIRKVVKNNIVVITGGAGCVDCDTEYFNGVEWKKISKYDGDNVLQYTENGVAELVKPNAYIMQRENKLNYLETIGGLNMCISDNHTFLYTEEPTEDIGCKSKLLKDKFINIKEKINKGEFNGYVINSSFYTTCGYSYTKITKENTTISDYTTKDGFEYCFNVPSHMLVLKRNGRIFITGNCGKTTVINGFVKTLPDNFSVAQTALSGQAAKRISDVTGYPSSTIHRLLGFTPGKGFLYNKDNKLSHDVIVLDETSMIPLDLFWNLIKSINNSTKLIMCGDLNQIVPLGIGNLFSDLLNSKIVPKQRLTKIHRQAAKSGIITVASDVKDKKQIVDEGANEREIIGELKDLILSPHCNKNEIFDDVIETYKKEYKILKDVKDLQIIVPMKERGDLSVMAFNNAIQGIVNKNDNKYIKMGNKYIIKVGDKVINRKNNYRLFDIDYNPVSVFNGSMGIVEEIYDDYMVIDFFNIGRIRITEDLYIGIQLAYAVTANSFQGQQERVIITALDYSSYILLSSEWVYTAITRASKRCYLIAETKALRYATVTTKIKGRNTFLKELLER